MMFNALDHPADKKTAKGKLMAICIHQKNNILKNRLVMPCVATVCPFWT
jgi:hypothetical protein